MNIPQLSLENVPPVKAALLDMDTEESKEIVHLLKTAPLAWLLESLIKKTQNHADEKKRNAFFNVGKKAIDRFEMPENLYLQICGYLEEGRIEDALNYLCTVKEKDYLLLLNILTFISEILLDTEHNKTGLSALKLSNAFTVEKGLPTNEAITNFYLGRYLFLLNTFDEAEVYLRKSWSHFKGVSQEIEYEICFFLSLMLSLKIRAEPGSVMPEDLETILDTAGNKARAGIYLSYAYNESIKNNVKRAEEYLNKILGLGISEESLPSEYFKILSRIERYKGQLSKSDLSLDKRRRYHTDKEFVFSKEYLKEQFYYHIEAGNLDKASSILEKNHDTKSSWGNHQLGILQVHLGKYMEARIYFKKSIEIDDDAAIVAQSLGMLGIVGESAHERRSSLHRAIGQFRNLDMKLNHAISLSHLGIFEAGEAIQKKEIGVPLPLVHQFTEARNYFIKACEIADELGDSSLIVDCHQNLARLEFNRENFSLALDYCKKVIAHFEIVYLSFISKQKSDEYFEKYRLFFDFSISCALYANEPEQLFFLTEQIKGRRLLRDKKSVYTKKESQDQPEDDKLYKIRTKFRKGQALTYSEKDELLSTESRLINEWQSRTEAPDRSIDYSQPLTHTEVISTVYGEGTASIPTSNGTNKGIRKETTEFQGGGKIQCNQCSILNKIGSTYCSSCGHRLPKSAQINFDLFTGGEKEIKFAYAESLYNEAIQAFHSFDFEQTERLLKTAIEHAGHPDYFFFYGLCRLTFGDPESAIRAFTHILDLQYKEKYPFWPLPIKPTAFYQMLESLKQDHSLGDEIFYKLLKEYTDFYKQDEHEG